MISDFRTMPHSDESERAVLACILLDPATLALIVSRLRPADFYLERHATIYQAMIDIAEDDRAIDLRTLQAWLEQQAKSDEVGGIAYLASLDLDLPDLGRVDTYVEIVKERSIRRRLIEASGEIIRDALDGGRPAPDILGSLQATLIELLDEGGDQDEVIDLRDIVGGLAEKFIGLAPGQVTGIPTGLHDLDAKTGGFAPGQLVVIAARPGMGKTALLAQSADHQRRHGYKPAVISLEMAREELGTRELARLSDVPANRMAQGHTSQKQRARIVEAAASIRHHGGFLVSDRAGARLSEICMRARLLKAQNRLDVLYVDYLGLIIPDKRDQNRVREVGEITRTLKKLAKDLAIVVVLLSQLNRELEKRSDKRPVLSDLRESGDIEQDADLVVFIHRPEVYDPDAEEEAGLAELIVAKNRRGAAGIAECGWIGETTRFFNLAHHTPSPEH